MAWIQWFLGNTLLQASSVCDCPGPERGIFSIAIVDLIVRGALVVFSLLRASYFYNLKGLVCYVYSVYNPYSYCELSIYVLFILLQDAQSEVHLLLFYLDLQ